MTNLKSHTATQLRQFISIKDKIEALEAELAAITGGAAAASASVPFEGREKYERSTEARAAKAAAAKAGAKAKAAGKNKLLRGWWGLIWNSRSATVSRKAGPVAATIGGCAGGEYGRVWLVA